MLKAGGAALESAYVADSLREHFSQSEPTGQRSGVETEIRAEQIN